MYKKYDVIIIGAGIAGLYSALNIDCGLKVLVLSKNNIELSNSGLAQGGIATVFDTQNDSFDQHINDTLVAGGFQNNNKALDVLVHQGPVDVKKLIDLGVEFDKDANGNIHLTLEGGHLKKRILHYKDSTGSEIIRKLIIAVKKLDNVDIIESAMACNIVQAKGGYCIDVLINEEHLFFCANNIVIATGGIGRVFEYTTNSSIATGDGIMLAYKLGAKIKNISLVQFHPTAFANANTRECFLISEAVRGEGAYLLNCNYERFMHRYDNRLELAPRDVVSRAIITESRRTQSESFYLDITHKSPEFITNRFPMIYKILLKEGYDITKQKIPVFPCQHYLMGGIDVDIYGKTSVDGIYAVGECSHTGVHGNNRLASNSLLEAIVFARLLAVDINNNINKIDVVPFNFNISSSQKKLPVGIRTEIRAIMQSSHFVMQDVDNAHHGFKRIKEILSIFNDDEYKITKDYIEARSLATVAYLILKEVLE